MANSAYDMSADRASRLIRRYLEEDLQVEPDRASDQQFRLWRLCRNSRVGRYKRLCIW